MALSKTYTLKKLRSLIRVLVKEIAPSSIQDEIIDEILNYKTLELAEMLNGAALPDYAQTANVSDAASSYSTTVVTGGTYSNSTRTVTKSTHGYTIADIGKRIVLYHSGRMGVAEIESITSTSAFVITKALGTDISSGLSFAVLSPHATSYADLSSLAISDIIKLVDATNGLVSEAKDLEFEGLGGIDQYSNSVFYNYLGEKLHLFKGSNVTWGTLTLHYYRTPTLMSADTDYVDVPDKYVPLLITMSKLEIYEVAKQTPPEALQQNYANRTAFIRQANNEKQAAINQKKG